MSEPTLSAELRERLVAVLDGLEARCGCGPCTQHAVDAIVRELVAAGWVEPDADSFDRKPCGCARFIQRAYCDAHNPVAGVLPDGGAS